jgi:hypothetical protein
MDTTTVEATKFCASCGAGFLAGNCFCGKYSASAAGGANLSIPNPKPVTTSQPARLVANYSGLSACYRAEFSIPGFTPAKFLAVETEWDVARSVTVNWSQRRNSVVRRLLLSLTLIAIPASAATQQKKPSTPEPSKLAAPPPKPAAARKPAEAPKPVEAPKHEAKPAEIPKHEARPATGSTGDATHTGTTGAARTGTSATPHAGIATGVRTGGTTDTRTRGTVPAAKTGAEREYKAPVIVSRPGGGKSVTNTAGHTANFSPEGKKTSFETKGGTKANFDHNGYIRTIHTRSGMTINHGAHGERRFESRRPDDGRVVGFGHGRGYTEHGYFRGGHPYIQRTYFYDGRRYAYAYRGYYWHGHPYYGYVPPYYFGAAYYGWAYGPWAGPVAFDWGWGAAPWYRVSGYYFAPAPAYDSPALWLTDYLLAANLQAVYEARAQANAAAAASDAAAGGQATITPELKQLIAEEVRAQIAAEKAAADNPEPAAPVSSAPPSAGKNGPDEVPAGLDPSLKTFLVSTLLSESMADGTECSLSPGDILTRIQDTSDANQSVKVVVASSQRNDCVAGTQIAMAFSDLQNMHNDFRAKLSEALGKLAENQGKNGIPSGPPADSKLNPNGQAQPDLTVEADLKAQQAEAGQAESDVQQATIINPDIHD